MIAIQIELIDLFRASISFNGASVTSSSSEFIK